MMTRLYPSPVLVTLGGEPHGIPPLRIRDLAALETLAGSLVAPPASEPPPELGADAWGRARWLARQYREAQDWPPAWDSPAGAAVLGTTLGRAGLLLILLGPGRGGDLDLAGAIALAERASEPEWQAVRAAALGLAPAEILLRRLDPRSVAGDPLADRITLAEAIDDLAEERGWTYEQIGDMTLSQFRMARAGGRPGKVRLIPRPGQTLIEAAQWRKRLVQEPDPGPPPGWTPDDFGG